MDIRFWGCRGSIPASMPYEAVGSKIKAALRLAVKKGLGTLNDIDAFIEKDLPFAIQGTYGFNTPCVEIRDGDSSVLCDAGSGLRDFGHYLMNRRSNHIPKTFHIVISHLHWDHIQGFPFFSPALNKENRILIYGCHEDLVRAFTVQQNPPFFPLALKDMAADIRFVELEPGKPHQIQGFCVTPQAQNHPGESYGYRFEKNGKAVVYSGDLELQQDHMDAVEPVASFFSGADLMIFDAQYTSVEVNTTKKNWGHSCNLIGVELARKAGVKHLCLFHHDPASTDEDLDNLLSETIKFTRSDQTDHRFTVSIAWDGMVVHI